MVVRSSFSSRMRWFDSPRNIAFCAASPWAVTSRYDSSFICALGAASVAIPCQAIQLRPTFR